MARRHVLFATIVFGFVALALAQAPSSAEARTPEDALAGQVALGKAPLPGKKGDASFLRALKRATRTRAVFHADDKAGKWTIHYAAVAPRPLRDVAIKIFDVTHGKQFVGTRDKMLFAESRIVTGTLTLARDEVFRPNARMLVEFEAGGRIIAKRTFYIQGKAERFSGKVEFEAEEVGAGSGGDVEDDLAARPRRK